MKSHQLPVNVQTLVVNSSDTNDIPVASALSGQTVKVWGFMLSGGTSVVFKNGTTALTGAVATPQTIAPNLAGPKTNGQFMPLFESDSNGTINLTPGATGLKGVVWFSQDAAD